MSFLENFSPLSEFATFSKAPPRIRRGIFGEHSVTVLHNDKALSLSIDSLASHICETYIHPELFSQKHLTIVRSAIAIYAQSLTSPLSLDDFIRHVLVSLVDTPFKEQLQHRKKDPQKFKAVRELILSGQGASVSSAETIPLRLAPASAKSKASSVAIRQLAIADPTTTLIASALKTGIDERDPFLRTLLFVNLGELLLKDIGERIARGEPVDQNMVNRQLELRRPKAVEEVSILAARLKNLHTYRHFLPKTALDRLSETFETLSSLQNHSSPWTQVSYESIFDFVSQARKEMHAAQSSRVKSQIDIIFSQSSEDAAATAFDTLLDLFRESVPYSQFLNDLQKLQQRGITRLPFVQQLAKQVMLNLPGLSPLHGTALAGQLLCLADHGLPLADLPDDFQAAAEEITRRATALVSQANERYLGSVQALIDTPVYSEFGKHRLLLTHLPKAIADLVLLQDGTLNIGLIGLVKDVFLHKKDQRDSLELYLSNVLNQLRSDPTLGKKIEQGKAPTVDAGRHLVNVIVGKELASSVTDREARVACLASLLTWHRQGCLGDCFLTAALTSLEDMGRHWLVEDFQELLSTGTITRTYEGRPVEARGLLWPALFVIDLEACKTKSDMKKLFQSPVIQQACREIGILDQSTWNRKIDAIKPPIGTFRDLFEKISGLPLPEEIDKIQRALFIIEAPLQPPMHTVWKNAIGTLPTIALQEDLFKGVVAALQKIGVGQRLFPKKYRELLDTLIQSLHVYLVPQTAGLKELSFVVFEETEGKIVPLKEEAFVHKVLSLLGLTSFEGKSEEFASAFKHAMLNPQAKADGVAPLPPLSGILSLSKDIAKAPPFAISGIYERKVQLGSGRQEIASRGGGQGVRAFIKWAREIADQAPPGTDLRFLAHQTNHQFRLLPTHPDVTECFEETEAHLSMIEETSKKVASEERPFHEWKQWIATNVFVELYHGYQHLDFGDDDGPCTLESAFDRMLTAMINAAARTFSDTEIDLLSTKGKKTELKGIMKRGLMAHGEKAIATAIQKKQKRSFHEWTEALKETCFVDAYKGYSFIDLGNEIDECTFDEAMDRVIARLEKAMLTPPDERIQKKLASTDGQATTKKTLLLQSMIKLAAEKGVKVCIRWADTNWIESGSARPVYFAHFYNPWNGQWECISVGQTLRYIGLEKTDRLKNVSIEPQLLEHEQEAAHETSLLAFHRTASKQLQILENAFTASWQALLGLLDPVSKENQDQILQLIHESENRPLEDWGISAAGKYSPPTTPPRDLREAFVRCLEIQARYRTLIQELCHDPGEYRVVHSEQYHLYYIGNEGGFHNALRLAVSAPMAAIPSPIPSPPLSPPPAQAVPLSPLPDQPLMFPSSKEEEGAAPMEIAPRGEEAQQAEEAARKAEAEAAASKLVFQATEAIKQLESEATSRVEMAAKLLEASTAELEVIVKINSQAEETARMAESQLTMVDAEKVSHAAKSAAASAEEKKKVLEELSEKALAAIGDLDRLAVNETETLVQQAVDRARKVPITPDSQAMVLHLEQLAARGRAAVETIHQASAQLRTTLEQARAGAALCEKSQTQANGVLATMKLLREEAEESAPSPFGTPLLYDCSAVAQAAVSQAKMAREENRTEAPSSVVFLQIAEQAPARSIAIPPTFGFPSIPLQGPAEPLAAISTRIPSPRPFVFKAPPLPVDKPPEESKKRRLEESTSTIVPGEEESFSTRREEPVAPKKPYGGLETPSRQEEPISDMLLTARGYCQAAKEAFVCWATGKSYDEAALDGMERQVQQMEASGAVASDAQRTTSAEEVAQARAVRRAIETFRAIEQFQTYSRFIGALHINQTTGRLEPTWGFVWWTTGVGDYLTATLGQLLPFFETLDTAAQQKINDTLLIVRDRYPHDRPIQAAVARLLTELPSAPREKRPKKGEFIQ